MNEPTRSPSETVSHCILLSHDREIDLTRPQVVGVLNVTPDSFSDGGKYTDTATAVAHGLEMVEEGAAVIDIGGESSRPGAKPVSPEEEQARVLPVIIDLRRQTDIPLSIDTYHAATAARALDAGADIVNDISALRFDPDMAALVAERRVPVVLMHMQGTPRDMQVNPHYEDCVREIAVFFDERIQFCESHGISRDRLILDPGIGFGKRLQDNLDILARLREFRRFGLPLLVGASRKSFIGLIHPSGKPADQRLGGSLAAAVVAVLHGAKLIRAHDVAATVEALKLTETVNRTT